MFTISLSTAITFMCTAFLAGGLLAMRSFFANGTAIDDLGFPLSLLLIVCIGVAVFTIIRVVVTGQLHIGVFGFLSVLVVFGFVGCMVGLWYPYSQFK